MPPVDPDLQPLLDHLAGSPAPRPVDTPIADRRAAHLLASSLTELPAAEMASVRECTVAGAAGPLDARLYEPLDDDGEAFLIYFHGGGFTLGTLDSYDGLARHLASVCHAPLLSIAYRLAPEHPFPAAPDDALASTRDVVSRMHEFAPSSRAVVVVGDSAGATLAAVVAQQLGTTGCLAGQVLLYPTMGPALTTASAVAYATGYVLEVDHLRHHYAEYLGDWTDWSDPRVTPSAAQDLTGVPPAVIVAAEFDPLHDEALAYASQLERAGVAVTVLDVPGMVHSFYKLGGIVRAVPVLLDELGTAVRAIVDARR